MFIKDAMLVILDQINIFRLIFFYFCHGVYVLKSRSRREDMLRLLSYFRTKFIKFD